MTNKPPYQVTDKTDWTFDPPHIVRWVELEPPGVIKEGEIPTSPVRYVFDTPLVPQLFDAQAETTLIALHPEYAHQLAYTEWVPAMPPQDYEYDAALQQIIDYRYGHYRVISWWVWTRDEHPSQEEGERLTAEYRKAREARRGNV